MTSNTNPSRRGAAQKENPRDHNHRLRQERDDSAALRPLPSRRARARMPDLRRLSRAARPPLHPRLPAPRRRPGLVDTRALASLERDAFGPRAPGVSRREPAFSWRAGARRGHEDRYLSPRAVRRAHLRQRGRGSFRGLPRDGHDRGRMGGGRPLRARIPDDRAAVGGTLPGLRCRPRRRTPHRDRALEGRQSGALRGCLLPRRRARPCVRPVGFSRVGH